MALFNVGLQRLYLLTAEEGTTETARYPRLVGGCVNIPFVCKYIGVDEQQACKSAAQPWGNHYVGRAETDLKC